MGSKQLLKSAAWCAAVALCGLPGCASDGGGGRGGGSAFLASTSGEPLAIAEDWGCGGPCQTRAVGGRVEGAAPLVGRFDPLYIVSAPLIMAGEAVRWFVMEDADSYFKGATFESFVSYKPAGAGQPADAEAIGPDDEFEVLVDYVAIDNFSDGTVRQAWGGNGGEVSIQASMLALGTHGRPFAADPSFLNHRDVRRRCAMAALLKGNERGAKIVEKAEQHVSDALAKLNSAREVLDEVETRMQAAGALTAANAILAWDGQYAPEIRAWAEQKLAGNSAELRAVGRLVTENVLTAVREWLVSLPANDTVGAHAGELPAQLANALDVATATLDYLGSFGVGDEGIYQNAKVISGLADADRMLTLEFEDVRPSLIGLDRDPQNTGTADVVLNDTGADTGAYSPRGRVFKGTLRELASLGTVGGFSLSFLMLERDDDRVVQALRIMQQYADEKGLTIGGGVSEVKASALIDAIAILAEKIAEDDVELRAVDVRFMPAPPVSGATPGVEILPLRTCRVLVSRNLDGDEFGAIARITIRKTRTAAGRVHPVVATGVAAR